jgi:SAM-dependent methyltransferase
VADWPALLRERWRVVPGSGPDRVATDDLLQFDDRELLRFWRASRDGDASLELRGWYRLLYADFVRGRRLLDIGCGLAFDTLTFAEQGARVVCADLSSSNVALVDRLARLLGVEDRVTVAHLESPDRVTELIGDFDAILAIGSLHHAPQEIVGPEIAELSKRVVTGGRWLQFAYPRARWEHDGGPPFNQWGETTDGPGTPWAEWYDAEKISALLGQRFALVFSHEWHDREFNWFDFVRVS